VPWLFPGWAGLFVIEFPGEGVNGRRMRFVVNDQDWALAQARGGRIAAVVQRRARRPTRRACAPSCP
jgi:hypothetical protein